MEFRLSAAQRRGFEGRAAGGKRGHDRHLLQRSGGYAIPALEQYNLQHAFRRWACRISSPGIGVGQRYLPESQGAVRRAAQIKIAASVTASHLSSHLNEHS